MVVAPVLTVLLVIGVLCFLMKKRRGEQICCTTLHIKWGVTMKVCEWKLRLEWGTGYFKNLSGDSEHECNGICSSCSCHDNLSNYITLNDNRWLGCLLKHKNTSLSRQCLFYEKLPYLRHRLRESNTCTQCTQGMWTHCSCPTVNPTAV